MGVDSLLREVTRGSRSEKQEKVTRGSKERERRKSQ